MSNNLKVAKNRQLCYTELISDIKQKNGEYMIKEICVAGIKLGNYTVRESLMRIDRAFYENNFTTVEEVYMRSLFLAREDQVVKQVIESMDVIVIAEMGILDVAGEKNLQRKYEIEENEFFYQLLKRIERGNKKIFLLGEIEKEIELAREFILDEFPKVTIAGALALSKCVGDEESVINEINTQTPDVIISVLPSPKQEHFLHCHKDKLSANLWYGIGDGKFAKRRHRITTALIKLFRVKKLMKYIKRYEKQEE